MYAPCKGIRIPECGKFLLMESGIQENFACGSWILDFGIQNTEVFFRGLQVRLVTHQKLTAPLLSKLSVILLLMVF